VNLRSTFASYPGGDPIAGFLAPGPNDVSRLAPGVYFVRRRGGAAQQRAVILR